MNGNEHSNLLTGIRSALRMDARIGADRHKISLGYENGTLIMEGEVEELAAKKLALEAAAAFPEVAHIADRLRVVPATVMGDGAVRDHIAHALLIDPDFADCAVRVRDKRAWETIRAPDRPVGSIDVTVADGVVTLSGDVPSFRRKRLAGAAAWHVPGTRDVVNGLGIAPPEDDSDEEMAHSVRAVIEKDSLLKGQTIQAACAHSVVMLTGFVTSEAQRRAADFDAWCVFGVDRVINRLEVRP